MTAPHREKLDPSALAAALRTSPEQFLRQRFGADLTLSGGGRSVRVKRVMRGDRHGDGTWVHCTWQGGAIGDNISLVRHLLGCGFIAAIETLVGTATRPVPQVAIPNGPPVLTRPRVPPMNGIAQGRAYLQGRGISPHSILAAEQAGALRYCHGAVLFTGRDHSHSQQEIRLAALRYLVPKPVPDDEPITKRDLAGSSKTYPVLLPGSPDVVAIVEGGVNALGVRDIGLRRGVCPSVIVTGGVGVRHWVSDNPYMCRLLAGAKRVLVFGENEMAADGGPDPAKQAETDALRHRLAKAVGEVRLGELPDLIYPPAAVKDAADWALAMLRQHGPVPEPECDMQPEPETEDMTMTAGPARQTDAGPQPGSATGPRR